MRWRSLHLGASLWLAISALGWSADWPQFRGPQGAATSEERNLPLKWSADENIAWRIKLPGPGTSSPVVIGDRVFLTCYSGYALSADEPGEMKDLRRHVLGLHRGTGVILWRKEVEPKLPESEYSGGNNSWHGYSSSTPASDGEFLYVFFGKSGVYCLDLDGKERWHTHVGDGTKGWGSSNSVVLFQNLVIVNASVESQSLVALDKGTGKEVWRAANIRGSWNTPVLVPVPGSDKQELVVSLPERLQGLDPASGKELWECDGIPDSGYVCPSVVAHDGVVYAIGGRKNTALAVRVGGRGDVTESHVLWKTDKGSNVSSPVYHDGYLYWVHERQGTANCLDARTGKVVYQERLEPRPGVIYASILAADGKLYAVSQHNGTYVLAAKPEFQLLAHNVIAGDDSRTNASPAVHDGQLLLRSDRYLYCIGTPASLLKPGE